LLKIQDLSISKGMKKTSKIIFGILLFLLSVIAVFFIFIKIFTAKPLPDYNAEITISGMKDEVVIYRDKFAIPHIYAKNQEDLYKAVGYVMAQDRLWQMDLIRRVTQGRISEIFGIEYVDTDFLFRALQLSEKSRIVIDSLDIEMIQMLNSFAEGVNYYIDNEELPVEFKIIGYKPEEWLPEHSLNIIGYIGWDLGTAWKSEILATEIKNIVDEEKFKGIIPDFKQNEVINHNVIDTLNLKLEKELISKTKMIQNLGIEPLMTSNNWSVSGDKSITGSPILANDMHLNFGIPGLWYQIHQVVDGELDVTGLAIPGLPVIIAGHNQNIAWGMTNVMLDDMDFYLETVNPENPHQYKFNGVWKEMEVKTEIIKTKEGDEIEKEMLYTHRGPIISEIKNIGDKSISMRWIGSDYSNELRAIYLLNRASDWTEFLDAIKTFICLSQNIVYADIQGNIGIYCAAGIPVRKGDGFAIQNGETDEYDWKGFVPFDSLPHEYNPERGFVSSANNKITENYPSYISTWFYQDYRIDRINEMLEAKEKFSMTDFQEMQSDLKSKMVEKFLPDIIYNASTTDLKDETVKKSLEMLSKWNGILSVESQAATIFEEFYLTFAENLIADELGEDLTKRFISDNRMINNLVEFIWANKYSFWCDNILTKDTIEDFSDVIIKSYIETIENLKTEFGDNPEKWYWGSIHTLTLEHPLSKMKIFDFIFNLNRGPYGVGGSHHTVCSYSYSFSESFEVLNGASHRNIFSTADWDMSLTILPTGISGQPASDYYCDQTELYVSNKYREDYFTKEKIIENSIYKMVIK
jgi:penicillin amidase